MLTTKVTALNSYSCFEDIISISLLFRRNIFRFCRDCPTSKIWTENVQWSISFMDSQFTNFEL